MAVVEMEHKNQKRWRLKPLKILALLPVIGAIVLFLRATVLRVETQMGASSAGGLAVSAVAVGFLALFLSGICYGLWVLLVEHYIAFSLTRDWVVDILRETSRPEKETSDNPRYAV
ncbi:MAG: hypothetical protein AB1426_02045 [Bacillota bacterium]